MTERKIVAWELIAEDDGSETMIVEYADGGREEFRGVTDVQIEKVRVDSDGAKLNISIPMTFTGYPK
jgi:hypothetical protein